MSARVARTGAAADQHPARAARSAVAIENRSSALADERLVEVRDLRVQFPTDDGVVKAVDGVSWHIDRGETVALVGESGSGKSVSAMALLRLTDMSGGRIASGEILFRRPNGRVFDIVREGEKALRDLRGNDVAMIFQEPMTSLNPVFRIGDQIAEAIILHQHKSRREARAQALEMLKLVRIPEAERQLDQYPHQLSGGMRQRAMIAMALSCRPALLIADEPTTALDVTIQAQILDLIRTLQREIGMSVLFITHDMGVVAEVADRVVVMLAGEVVEEGPVIRIFEEPRHAYTQALLDAVPKLGSMTGRDRPVRFPNVDVRRAESEAVTLPRDAASEAELEQPDTVRADRVPLLELNGLTTRFDIGGGWFARPKGRVHAVEDVSFSLRGGETLALVGESGCGKSTTGRSILKLVEPTRGSIRFKGEEIIDRPRNSMGALRRHMQMIFQDPFASLNPRMTVGWLIGEPLKIHRIASGGEIKDRVADLLRRVGLEPAQAERYPHEFSGGQRQRICIARALALNPDLIIADEAVSALDVSIQAQVINLMMDLQVEFGLAYLFISHDLAVVERIAHRVAVMYLGEIVELGPRRAVFEDPRHPYTRKLMAAVPVADPRQRRQELRLATDEIPSPLRPFGFEPEPHPLEEVAPGHFVMPH
ncbi:MAG TPA: ABC transporter ATP-binding protein [Geminicoccaceae bacterium]